MKDLILACASVVGMCWPAIGNGQLMVYTYTGQPYASTTEAGEYADSMRISGSMILPGPLAANIPSINSGVHATQFVSPVSFSFTDGLVTVTDANSTPLASNSSQLNFFTTMLVSTDNEGDIAEWYMLFRLATLPPFTAQVFSSIQVPGLAQADSARLNSDVAFSSGATSAGTWTVSAIPEPTVYVLMLAGIGMVGCVALKRRRTA